MFVGIDENDDERMNLWQGKHFFFREIQSITSTPNDNFLS